MTDRYLLDTNILSDLVRNPSGRVASQIGRVGPTAVLTSIVAASELRYGAAKKGSQPLTTRVEGVLSRLEIAPFEPPAHRFYAELRVGLEQRGVPVGAHDMLLAAHALALDAVLVTANIREFARVEGLSVENWLS